MIPDIASQLRRIKSMVDDDFPGAEAGLLAVYDSEVVEKSREICWKATTDDVDMEGEVVVPAGARMEYWERNHRRVFVEHRLTPEYHIGACRWLKAWPSADDHRGWACCCQIFKGLKSPVADDIWEIAVQAGIGASVGMARVKYRAYSEGNDPPRYKGARVIHDWVWLELSATPCPVNASCQSISVAEREAEKALKSGRYDRRLGVIDDVACKSKSGSDLLRALGMKPSPAMIQVPKLPPLRVPANMG